MKINFTLFILIFAQLAYAQFFEKSPISTFPCDGVSASSIAFADVDGDNDMDAFITGSGPYTGLFKNDGNGNYCEVANAPFEGVDLGAMAFADIDGDNDMDVIISGQSISSGLITILYKNNGQGDFSEVTNTPFEGVIFSALAFADVDGDNDNDVLISGRNSSGDKTAKLYKNNGTGFFSEVMNTPFGGLRDGAIAFSDVDGDDDMDLFITGNSTGGGTVLVAKLFINDGLGNFTEMMDNPFEGVRYSAVAFEDVDGDGDTDLMITGEKNVFDEIAKLYINDGTGNFSEAMNTPFEGVEYSSIAFEDVDGDNDKDLLITGLNNSDEGISILYSNDGAGNFSEVMDTPFEGVQSSSIAFADVNNDSNPDLLITGRDNSGDKIANLYFNDGLGNFTKEVAMDRIASGSLAFADIDGDQDNDLLQLGASSSGLISKLYTNDGVGKFSEVMNTPFDGVYFSSVAFSDVDGDNDRDLLITGRDTAFERIAKLYSNDGTGNFSEMINTPFDGVDLGSIAFADVDGDNDNDLLITGRNNADERIAKLYSNDGTGNFSEVMNTPFDGVDFSSIAIADINGDNSDDIVITGRNNADDKITKLYTNDGAGNFSEVLNTPLEGVYWSSIAFSDYDGDLDQDLIITGINSSSQRIAKLYINDGTGNFSELMNTPFVGVFNSSIAFADFDGDNDVDVFIMGELFNSNFDIVGQSNLYINDGEGNFFVMANAPFPNITDGSLAVADIDGDNDDDIILSGKINLFNRITELYINTSEIVSSDEVATFKKLDVLIFPNPNENGNTSLVYNALSASDIEISIFNSVGVLLSQQKLFASIGVNNYILNFKPPSSGNYFVKVSNGIYTSVVNLVIQ